jgi:hypothetical protein
MISDKGTKQELSTESTFPDIPDFSSFVLELLQGPVTWSFLSACRTEGTLTKHCIGYIYRSNEKKNLTLAFNKFPQDTKIFQCNRKKKLKIQFCLVSVHL